jgi:hypothetical protein
MGGASIRHRRDGKCIRNFTWKPEGKRHLGDLGIDGSVILKWILKKQDMRVLTGVSWSRTECSGGLLFIRYCAFGFPKRLEIS